MWRTMPRSWVISRIAMPNRACKVFEQRENLRLYGHIERGSRFVGDEQVWLVGQGHGNHHPLALTARKLVRPSV